ncbi:MAG: hypothetical protein Kow00109_25940 [Acidobacteriota bacterium]
MAKQVKLPELGENIEGGDVVSVLVQEGDVLDAGRPVLELETDKATVEVPAEVTGKVTAVLVKPGDHVKVGQPILEISEEAAAGGEAQPAGEAPQPGREPAGKAAGEPAPPAPAPASEEAVPPASAPPARGEVERKPLRAVTTAPAAASAVVQFAPRPAEGAKKVIPASPAVRRFAREIGVDISQVPGSGPQGRITIDDVKAYSRSLRRSAAGAPAPAAELPDFERFGPVEREAFSNVRRATAEHLAVAWSQVVHVTNHDRADITELEEWRRRNAPRVEAAGGKLTVTAILLKVAAAALQVFPKFNASIDMARREVVYKHYVNIGVAVDTPRGLLVPVVRDVDRKNLVTLAVELQELAGRAREGKIRPEELQGGCFTITNLGGIGGTSFTPIVNFPEVAILGVSRATVEPVFVDDGFEPRRLLPLSLSYDHRLIDGADAARFLRWICEALEDPWKIWLEG